ncbi:tetratricopeptide repeat protein [Candidatus Poribacteria bacterium]|nr:tetratricopeptide repeat protein [Candidatus Poribacteria bacterium]
MPFNTKSLFSLRSWLFYAEVLAVIGFIVIAALYIRRGSAESEAPTATQIGGFIEKADVLFEKQDLADAALFYWQGLRALETTGDEQRISINGTPQSNAEVRLHANLRISEIYSHSNWLKDAKARLEYAARIQPEHSGVRLLRGKLFRDEGFLSEATEEFLAVLKQDPHHAEAHYLLGVLYQGSKQYKSAAEYYSKAIENDPELRVISSEKAPIGILARLQLSRTYARMLQDYQFLDREFTDADLAEVNRLESEAIRLLEEAHEKYPEMNEVVDDLVRLLFARATALEREDFETRQYGNALRVYERIVELDPQEVRALERMGEIYASFLGDKAAALEIYRKVYEIEPHPTVLANVKSLEEDVAAEMESEE